MQTDAYSLARLVEDLREARATSASEAQLIGRVRRIGAHAAARRDEWLRAGTYRPDAAQGFGFHLLHEEPDHALAVFIASWLPGRGTPPHDHGTWAVVVGLEGCERNTHWSRVDDGSRDGCVEIVPAGDRLVGPGDVVAMRTGAIHSVRNESDRVSASLHIYGRHVNHTDRSRFDPELRTRSPYRVATTGEAA